LDRFPAYSIYRLVNPEAGSGLFEGEYRLLAVFHNYSIRRAHRRAFTLLESLMAAGILLAVVVSATSAITAGQQHAYEAHQRIAAGLAGEELMGRLLTVDYDALPTWNGYAEAAGAMVDMTGATMPQSFASIGRDVQITTALRTIPDVDVRVRGRMIHVRAFNAQGRVLAELDRFIPEPQP
jgi:hypothetical protein